MKQKVTTVPWGKCHYAWIFLLLYITKFHGKWQTLVVFYKNINTQWTSRSLELQNIKTKHKKSLRGWRMAHPKYMWNKPTGMLKIICIPHTKKKQILHFPIQFHNPLVLFHWYHQQKEESHNNSTGVAFFLPPNAHKSSTQETSPVLTKSTVFFALLNYILVLTWQESVRQTRIQTTIYK